MQLKDISPFVRLAMVADLPPADAVNRYQRICTRDSRAFCGLRGSGRLHTTVQSFSVSPGSCILLPAGTAYRWQPDAHTGLQVASVNFDYTDRFADLNHTLRPVPSLRFQQAQILDPVQIDDCPLLNDPVCVEDGAGFQETFYSLTTTFSLQGAFCRELLSATMKTLIIGIARSQMSAPEAHSVHEAVQEMVRYIQHHYREPIDNHTIADRLHFHPVYCNRIFKNGVGQSIHQFLLQYRLRAAMDLLDTTDASIQDVAERVGFPDAAYFSRCFKKKVGQTPSEYQKNG